jgi:hypothetical protein
VGVSHDEFLSELSTKCCDSPHSSGISPVTFLERVMTTALKFRFLVA